MSLLKQSLKLPAQPKDKVRNITKFPVLVEGEVVTNYTQKDVRPIFQKLSYPIFLDLSEGIYLLESDDFMKSCTNVVKELNLSSNSLIEIESLGHLNKLKRLILNRNNLIDYSVQGLSSLVYLGLCNNRLDRISEMSDCKKLVNIDLSGNRLSGEGFDNFSKLKSLKVLDVSSNSINCSLIDFQKKILDPLKKSKTLEYLSFENNIIEKRYEEFRLFVINELPKLKYLNWILITKEERLRASKLETEGFFSKQLSIINITPTQNIPTPSIPTPSSTSVTSVSVGSSPTIRGSTPTKTSFIQRKPSVGANMLPKLASSLTRSTDLLSQQKEGNSPIISPVSTTSIDEPPTMSPFDIQQSKISLSSSLDNHNSGSSQGASGATTTTTASQILQEIKPTNQLTRQETEDYMDILLNELQPNNSDFPTFASVIDQKVYLDLLYRAIVEDAIPDELIQECNKFNDEKPGSSSPITTFTSPSVDIINMPDEDDELITMPTDDDELPPTQVVSQIIPSLTKEGSRESLLVATIDNTNSKSTVDQHTIVTKAPPSTPQHRLPTLEETIESVVTNTTTSTKPIGSAKDIWMKIDQNAGNNGSPQIPNKLVPKRLPSQNNLSLNSNASINTSPPPPPSQSILKPVGSPSMKPIAKPIMKPMIKKPPATPITTTTATNNTITTTTTTTTPKVDYTSEIDKAVADINSWNLKPAVSKPAIPQELLTTILKQKAESESEKVENATSKLDEMIMEYQASPKTSPKTSPINTRKNVVSQQPEQLQRMISQEQLRTTVTTPIVLPNWVVPKEEIQVGSKLGMGNFGDCFTANSYGLPTILKKLRTQRFTDQFLEQFKNEVYQLRELQQENLIPVSGCCVDTNIYIIHPQYDANSLQTLLFEPSYSNMITNEFIHRVSLGISKAMTYLHSHDVIHRSLKLNNILIERLSGNVLIRDYGFTFVKDGILKTGQQGSPYLAPELFSSPQYTINCDQFSFAMVLLQLFTRSPLFQDIHVTRITDSIAQGIRPEIPDSVPSVFNRLIKACWSADPTARPSFLTISKILSQPFQRIFALAPSATITKPTISTGSGAVVQQQPSSDVAGRHQFSETGELNRKMILVLERIVSMLSVQPSSVDSIKRALKALENLSSPENHSLMVGIGLMKSLCLSAMGGHSEIDEQLLRVIYSLSTNEQLSNEFILAGGFEPLSSLVSSSNQTISLLAIKLVTVLSDEQHLNQVRDTGILSKLTDLLINGVDDQNILIQSVGAMSRILLNEDNQNQFISSGGVSVLLYMLINSSNSLSMRALLALCCLISNQNCKSQLHNADIIPKLMELLSSPQKLLRLHSLKVIETMAKDSEFRKLLIQQDSLLVLVQLLSSSTVDQDTITNVLSCIGSMLKSQSAYEAFFKCGGVNILCKLINYNQHYDILDSLFPVYCVLINHELSRQQLIPTVQQLVEILSNSNLKESVIISILKCLTQFANHLSCVEVIEHSMAISIVSTLLLRNENNYDIKIHSLRFISSLAKINNKLPVNVHIMGILQILVNNLQDKNSDIKDEAISTISWLSSSSECRSLLLQKNALSLLIDNVNTKSLDIIERLIWAISFFALDESAQSIIRDSDQCMNFILSCLDRKEDVFKTLSIKTVLILVQKQINHNALKSVGLDFQLQVLSSSPNRSIQLASKKILSLLN